MSDSGPTATEEPGEHETARALADPQTDPDMLVKSQDSAGLRRIRRSIDVYIGLTVAFSVLAIVPLVVFGLQSWGQLELGLFGLSLYGLGSAGLMRVARTRIVRRSHDATKWARFALISAAPLGLLMLYIGAVLVLVAGTSIVAGSIDWLTLSVFAIGLAGAGGFVLNGFTLARLFRGDLEKLLWESESEQRLIDESLNFLE